MRVAQLQKVGSAPVAAAAQPAWAAPPAQPRQAWGGGSAPAPQSRPAFAPPRRSSDDGSNRPGAVFRRHKAAVLEKFKATVLGRGGSGGIATLGRSFRIMDHDRSGSLDADELSIGLRRYGLPLSKDEIDELIDAIDKDGGGIIDYNEFLVALRGDINPRREKFIMMAFGIMDKDGSGVIDQDDVSHTDDCSKNPDVISGRMSEEECFRQFLGTFEGVEKDGKITKDEWIDYYRNVSASIDNDDYFELMMRNAWHITGGEGWCENTSNTRVMVVLSDGTQQVVCIEDDLGLNMKDQRAVMAKLKAQGLKDVVAFKTCA